MWPRMRSCGRHLWLVLAVIVAAGATLSLRPRKERDPEKVWAKAEEDLRENRFTEAEAGLTKGLREGYVRPRPATMFWPPRSLWREVAKTKPHALAPRA